MQEDLDKIETERQGKLMEISEENRVQVKDIALDIETYSEMFQGLDGEVANFRKQIPYLISLWSDDEDDRMDFWGDDCVGQFLGWVQGKLDLTQVGVADPKFGVVYQFWSFNGSKFDYLYLIEGLFR